MEGGCPSHDPSPSRSPSPERGSRARIRAGACSGDVAGSDSGDVGGSSADEAGPSASEPTARLMWVRTNGLSILANYQQHVVSCKRPGQLRSEALVCPCGKSIPPPHKLNFER
jgi:hypothetical protein